MTLRPPHPQEGELLVGSFSPVQLLGSKGKLVVTQRRVAFLAPESPGASADDRDTVVVSAHFDLVKWTLTERSKKTAKARFTYVGSSTHGGTAPKMCSVVADFGSDRAQMDACCAAIQSNSSAARALQAGVLGNVSFDTLHLASVFGLPPTTILKLAPSVLEQQEPPPASAVIPADETQAPTSDSSPPALSTAPVNEPHQAAATHASVRSKHRPVTHVHAAAADAHPHANLSVADHKTLPVLQDRKAFHGKDTRRGSGSAAPSEISTAASVPTSTASLEKLQAQAKRERMQRRERLQRQLLASNAELRSLYISLVGYQDDSGATVITDVSGQRPLHSDPVLTSAEFWKLHEPELEILEETDAPSPASQDFLVKPPRYERVAEAGGGDCGPIDDRGGVVVDCSEQMLKAILAEDRQIKAAYSALVETGRVQVDAFWERVFKSRQFLEAVGLPERTPNVGTGVEWWTDDGSTFLDAYGQLQAPRPQDVQHLADPGDDLISTEANRVRGFGTVDGFNSFGGDLVPQAVPTSRDSNGKASENVPVSNRLTDRFNRHSQKLLLQQLLGPAAILRNNPQDLQVPDQIHILTEQQEQFFRRREQALPRTSIRMGCVLPREQELMNSLRFDELEEMPAPKLQNLDVSRRQLYAAGARGATHQIPAEQYNNKRDDTDSRVCYADGKHDSESSVSDWGMRAVDMWLNAPSVMSDQNPTDPAVFETGRYMFVFNTKICQREKAAHAATFDYEAVTVNAVRVHQARITELLRHYYCTTLPEEKKRIRIIQALDSTKYELENTQESTFGPCAGAATKALCMPLFDQINAAKLHHNKIKRLLVDLRAQRVHHMMRQATHGSTKPLPPTRVEN